MVGPGRLELPTSRLSGVCSNQLSYRPLKRSARRAHFPDRNVSGERPRRMRDRTAASPKGGCGVAERETKTAAIRT